MTIEEIKEKLSQERDFGSRFPARIIFTQDLEAYTELESVLKGVCDVTVNVADFCRGPDTVPQFDKIKSYISENAEKQILLLSVGEYLRLCIKRELNSEHRQFPSFWEMQLLENSRTRVVMPMFGCRDIFDRVIGIVDERQQDFLWTLETKSVKKNYDVYIYSPIFEGSITPNADSLSLWFRNWQSILQKEERCTIITRHESNAETSYGDVNTKTIPRPFLFLKDYLSDGNIFIEEWEDDIFWNTLVDYVLNYDRGATFEQVATQILNVKDFEFIPLVARWNTLSDFHKELIWLWYRVNPTGDYYSYACQKAESASEIPDRIRDEIILIPNRSDSWIEERNKALKALNYTSFSSSYFDQLDKISLPETKLRLLTYQSHEERTYAVKVTSQLLRDGVNLDAVADMIDEYRALATYMRGKTDCDEEVDGYMAWYRKNKLINRYPGNYPVSISFDRFDSRYSLMHKPMKEDCVSFWIDGFGVEYVPLFLHELRNQKIEPVTVDIAPSHLPSETKYNHQWDSTDPNTEKWDRLDNLSHHGIPDDKSYYSCIVHQLAVFEEAAKHVKELLKEHDYVIITGDHGSSRFAALAFHNPSVIPITPPKGATVHCYGRFCELDSKSSDTLTIPEVKKVSDSTSGQKFLVMNNYQRFSTSGNVAGGNTDEHDVVGEVHGGNTVEERLVSVIVVKRKVPLKPIVCTPPSEPVPNRKGHVEANLTFNRKVSTLSVAYEGETAVCTKNQDETWKIVLEGVPKGDIILSVVANGKQLKDIVLKIKKGIQENKDLF